MIWNSIIQRCYNKKDRHYAQYGGRGISVCDRWQDVRNFIADMGEKPEGRSIDRINNDGNYSPENCRWATRKEQQRNTRWNVIYTFNGVTAPLSELCERFEKNRNTIQARIRYGWPIEKAFSVPIQPRKRKGHWDHWRHGTLFSSLEAKNKQSQTVTTT